MSDQPILDDPVIIKVRDIFNQFKQPYLLGPTEGGGEASNTNPEIQDMSNFEEGHKHLRELYMIFVEVVHNGGVLPSNADTMKRAVNSVFENQGIYPALRNNPELKEPLLYHAHTDLITFPDTISRKHINKLIRK
jgi:hypothetical protein